MMIQPTHAAHSECESALYTAALATPSSVWYSPKIRNRNMPVQTTQPTIAHICNEKDS